MCYFSVRIMAKIVGMEKQADGAKITLDVSDAEMRNLDLNNPVLVFSKNKLDLKATTHKVPSQSGSSLYVLLPAGLKKSSKKVPLKEKQQFKCGVVETVEGGYILYGWEN
jgi:hypothetical protein